MPNEWVPTIDTTNNQFVYTYTADEAKPSPTGYNLILSTQNTFIDKNIKIKTIIPVGGLSAGNTTVSASSNVTLLGSSQNSAPTGAYISVTGQGEISVGTAGWIAANTSENSTSTTLYYPLQSAQFNWGTGTDANKVYCFTAGYTPQNNSSAILTMNTTSVTQTNVTTVSGTTATGATATWGTGYITSGSIDPATFKNTATNGVSYVDISETTAAPVLISDDWLYIDRGYVDNIKIKLAKLIPDSAVKPAGASSYAEGLLSGYALYDENGILVTGTLGTITLPDDSAASATTNYTSAGTLYATTADQYLNIPAGFNAVNSYYKFNKLTSTNYSSGNIKYNVTIKVNNGSSDVYSVTGTFTEASTATSTNGAASANQILKNYGAWVDGSEITGTIESRSWPTTTASSATSGYSGTTFNTSASNRYINLSSGYYSANKYYLIRAVTTSNIDAANIKYGVTIKVGDSADDDRIATATGTFTQTPAGKSALVAEALREGYSGFINGNQVDGNMPDATITPTINLPTTSGKTLTSYITTSGASSSSYDVSIIPQYTNTVGYSDAHTSAQSGTTVYYKLIAPTFESAGGTISLVADTTATTTKHSIYTSSSISYITITDTEPDYSSGKVYIKISSTGQIKTTSSGAGALKANTTIATTGNKTRYVGLNLYQGDYTTV